MVCMGSRGRGMRRWLLAAFLALPLSARAERPLTYAEALEAAELANPELQRARIAVEMSHGSLLSSRGIFDPNLTIDGRWRASRTRGFFQGFPFQSESNTWDLSTGIEGTTPTGTGYSLTAGIDRNFSRFTTDFGITDETRTQDTYTSNLNFTITQQLLEGSRIRYNLGNVTISRKNLSISQLTAERTRLSTLAVAAEAYWAFAYQWQLRDIAQEAVAVAEEALRVGQLQVRAGELAPVEQTRLEAALVQARSDLLEAESLLEQTANTLLLAMGESPDQEILPATPPGEAMEFSVSVQDAVKVALAQNLDLAVARSQVELAELQERNARHALLPSLSARASGGIGAQDTSPRSAMSGLLDEDAFPYFEVSGHFSMPIGNRAARGERSRAVAEVLTRRTELEELERSIAAQVEQQVRILQSARRRMELADVNHRLARETLAAEEALAEVGRTIPKNVLEARTQVARTAAEVAKARTDYRLAQVQLLSLQGQLPADLP